MKQQWKQWADKFDALTLRERVMVFAACALALVFCGYFMVLQPLFSRHALLTASIAQNRGLATGVDKEIVLLVEASQNDPDQAARARLQVLLAETAKLKDGLRHMQSGLVAPERMLQLLESLLRQHARLRLVSMKTLPAGVVGEAPAAAPAPASPATAAGAAAAKPQPAAQVLHRHGVEVVVEGSYPDMVNYMQALQTMPTQVFWGKARLEADAYPVARLTLTLYTLGLDDTWMAL